MELFLNTKLHIQCLTLATGGLLIKTIFAPEAIAETDKTMSMKYIDLRYKIHFPNKLMCFSQLVSLIEIHQLNKMLM